MTVFSPDQPPHWLHGNRGRGLPPNRGRGRGRGGPPPRSGTGYAPFPAQHEAFRTLEEGTGWAGRGRGRGGGAGGRGGAPPGLARKTEYGSERAGLDAQGQGGLNEDQGGRGRETLGEAEEGQGQVATGVYGAYLHVPGQMPDGLARMSGPRGRGSAVPPSLGSRPALSLLERSILRDNSGMRQAMNAGMGPMRGTPAERGRRPSPGPGPPRDLPPRMQRQASYRGRGGRGGGTGIGMRGRGGRHGHGQGGPGRQPHGSNEDKRSIFRFFPWRFDLGVVDGEKVFHAGFSSNLADSALAFDAHKKAFLLDLLPTTTTEVLPPAMELIDAMIRLEDIVHQGVVVSAVKRTPETHTHDPAAAADDAEWEDVAPHQTSPADDMWDVIVTMTTRRPAQYFVPLKDTDGKLQYKYLYTATSEERLKHERYEALMMGAAKALPTSPTEAVFETDKLAQKLLSVQRDRRDERDERDAARPLRSDAFGAVLQNRLIAQRAPRGLTPWNNVLTGDMAANRLRHSLLNGLVPVSPRPRPARSNSRDSRSRSPILRETTPFSESTDQPSSGSRTPLSQRPRLIPAVSSHSRTTFRWSVRGGLVRQGAKIAITGQCSPEQFRVLRARQAWMTERNQTIEEAQIQSLDAALRRNLSGGERPAAPQAMDSDRLRMFLPAAPRILTAGPLMTDAAGDDHGYGLPRDWDERKGRAVPLPLGVVPLRDRPAHLNVPRPERNKLPKPGGPGHTIPIPQIRLPISPAMSNPDLQASGNKLALQSGTVPLQPGQKKFRTGILRWRRATEFDFSITHNCAEADAGTVRVDADVEHKVNQWLSHRFHLRLNGFQYRQLQVALSRLRLIESEVDEQYIDKTSLLTSRKPGPALPAPGMTKIILATTNLAVLPFPLRYLVEGLVSHSILHTQQVEEMVQQIQLVLGKYPSEREAELAAAAMESLYCCEHVVHVKEVVQKRLSVMQTVLKPKKKVEPPEPKRDVLLVYKAVMTPTRLLLNPASPETSNSVLRKYPELVDRFLRLQFLDEHEQLQVNGSVKSAHSINDRVGTIARVWRALDHGLEIAGRRYVFLAASASQARSHSCWFFAETGSKIKADDIRAAFGNLTKETVIAKFAARQGLPFSTTKPVNIVCKLRKPMDDIKRGKYCFTDGVGKCAQNVADEAAIALGLDAEDPHPSAIQIRLGGSKGMLSAWPHVKNREVFLRPSMIKFESPANEKGLNVVRVSRYQMAFLNRQFIILLSALGIPDKVFTDLFAQKMERYKDLACRAYDGSLSEVDIAKPAQTTNFPLRKALAAGLAQDPMVQDILQAVERRIFSDLRWNARVEVEKGAYLMGIADELGVLKEGEVFCQIVPPGQPPQVITGLCVVTRAPALHPGDIRRVKAVDHPDLRSMKNVIIFSTKGNRDLPSMLGGGDLDGDDFTLIWDPLMTNISEQPPADFPSQEPARVPWVTQMDIMENFINHILNDVLGICGNAHLAYADQEGPMSAKCVELCQVYSTAVDFAKSGIPAELPEHYRPLQWPDFMGKPSYMTYPGKSILGRLYRMVTACEPSGTFVASSDDPETAKHEMHARLAVELPDKVLEMVSLAKVRFDFEIASVMRRFRVSEIEIIASVVLRSPKHMRRRDRELKTPMLDAWRAAVDRAVQNCLDNMPKIATTFCKERGWTLEQLLAVATYQVAFGEDKPSAIAEIGLSEEDLPAAYAKLRSFGWILPHELIAIVEDKAKPAAR